MKIGVSTWSFREKFKNEPDFDIFKALDYTAELGFKSIEIMTGKADNPPEHIGGDSPKHLKKVKQYAKELGIDIACLATYNDFAYVADESWRLANSAYIQHWLRLSGEIGVPNIRMLTGYYGKDANRTHLEELVENGIRECVPVAENAGVAMAIENHSSVFFSGEAINGLIDRIGSKYVTTCPDPSNGYKIFDPESSHDVHEAMYANLEQMMPRASHAHLKIRDVHDDAIEGFDCKRLVAVYRKYNYNGTIAFEAIENGMDAKVLHWARTILEAAIATSNEA